MKVWNAYGSEHSMNLVLIGTFKQEHDADSVSALIEKIVAQAAKDEAFDIARSPPKDQRFSDDMLSLLHANRMYSLSPIDIEQFALDHSVDRNGNQITVRTDEADLSAFIKIFVDAGARVEIYSAHDYPEDKSKSD